MNDFRYGDTVTVLGFDYVFISTIPAFTEPSCVDRVARVAGYSKSREACKLGPSAMDRALLLRSADKMLHVERLDALEIKE